MVFTHVGFICRFNKINGFALETCNVQCGLYMQMVFIYRWSLKRVSLYFHLTMWLSQLLAIYMSLSAFIPYVSYTVLFACRYYWAITYCPHRRLPVLGFTLYISNLPASHSEDTWWCDVQTTTARFWRIHCLSGQ